MVSAPAMVAGGIAAGAPALILAPAPSGLSSLLSARAAAPEVCVSAVPGDSQASLTWSPALPLGDSFTLYEGSALGIGQPVTPGAVAAGSALVTGLTNGATYYFWLASKAPVVVSNAASVTPLAVPRVRAGPRPSAQAHAPTFCVSAVPGDSRVSLKWSPARPLGDSFTLNEGSAPGIGQPVTPGAVAAGSALVTGLTNGATYYFWLANKAPVVVSNAAAATPRAVPGAPAGLNATAGNAQVRLSWTAPASNGGLPITGYNVYRGTSPDGETGVPVNGSPVTGTSYPVTDLVNGTTYYFKVVAVNAAGPGRPSGEASAIPATRPEAPGDLTPVPGNAQVTLSWVAPASNGGSPVTEYDLYAATTDVFTGRPPLARLTGTVATVTGLVNGTTYYFRVTAVNRVGEGPAAAAKAIAVTVPGPPAGLTATAGHAQVRLSWTAPASNGGLPITGYIIYRGTSQDGETGIPVNGSPVTGTSYPVTGLVNGTTYYFKVVAVNAAGLSPLSEEASATLRPIGASTAPPSSTAPSTSNPPSTAPAFTAPTGLTAIAGDTQVGLSWTSPTSDGGSAVASYKIYVAIAPGVPGRPAGGHASSTYTTVKGLPNGPVYYFMVTAVNAAGQESPFSTQVSAKPAGSATGVQVGLNSPTTPVQLIALLATVAAMAAAGLFTLITRRGRRSRSPVHARPARTRARSREQMAVASDVRAVPDISRPDVLSVRDIGQEPTRTIRFEPHPGVATTTFKERRP